MHEGGIRTNEDSGVVALVGLVIGEGGGVGGAFIGGKELIAYNA
jgi:hypothetical protein